MAVTSVWDWSSTAMSAHSSGRSSLIVLPGQNAGETMLLGLLSVQRTSMALSDDSRAHPSSSFWHGVSAAEILMLTYKFTPVPHLLLIIGHSGGLESRGAEQQLL